MEWLMQDEYPECLPKHTDTLTAQYSQSVNNSFGIPCRNTVNTSTAKWNQTPWLHSVNYSYMLIAVTLINIFLMLLYSHKLHIEKTYQNNIFTCNSNYVSFNEALYLSFHLKLSNGRQMKSIWDDTSSCRTL